MAHQWPPPHDDVSLYMTAAGGLERERPSGDGAAMSYAYDPRDPVPDLGQDPSDRTDVLRFESAPLDEALEVVGKAQAELFVSADVPDTTLMAQLLDIYPSGRVTTLLDRAIMARYRDGLSEPRPLTPGKVERVVVDLWSTAIVFAPGHRIGLRVSGSNAAKYRGPPELVRARLVLRRCAGRARRRPPVRRACLPPHPAGRASGCERGALRLRGRTDGRAGWAYGVRPLLV